MEHDLEVFLKEKGYYTKFKPFIKTKVSVTEVKKEEIGAVIDKIPEGKLIRYEFKSDIDKIISEFVSKNSKLAESFEKNEKAEKCYSKILPRHVKRTGSKSIGKIIQVFRYAFSKSPMETSVIKQLEKRYQQRINKEIFCDDQVESINIGVFFLMIEHYIAKQRKLMNQKDVVKSDLADSSTKKTKLDNVLDSLMKIRELDVGGAVVDSYFGLVDNDYREMYLLLRSYYSDGKKFGKASKEELDKFGLWAEKRARLIKRMPQFKEAVQAGPHEILVTNDNECDIDPFVRFVLYGTTVSYVSDSMLLYPYFFDGSEKKELVINGKKTDIKGYSWPKDLSLHEAPTKECLDKKLKPIWFRDITKENKRYKKMSMKELHEIAFSYDGLLQDKIIKYIAVEYKCERDRILVSFKTNHFDVPPKFLTETEFKKLLRQDSGTVLYRGMRELEHLKTLKEKRLSSIINKHRKRSFGTGLYWSKSFHEAEHHGRLVVMGVAVDHISDAAKNILGVLSGEVAAIDVYLMKDNQAVLIREKAMFDARGLKSAEHLSDEEYENRKKLMQSAGVLFCETNEEVDKWLKCE